jgi:hypothetical protein
MSKSVCRYLDQPAEEGREANQEKGNKKRPALKMNRQLQAWEYYRKEGIILHNQQRMR